jgi:hypothetical protein
MAILMEKAARYFLAVDVTSPLDAQSYHFPFCRVTDAAGVVAAKIGWRQSLAALENSNMPEMLVSDARALCDRLEARLGDVKTAARRREAAALVAKAKTFLASTDACPEAITREQRLAEAQKFRRMVVAMNGK